MPLWPSKRWVIDAHRLYLSFLGFKKSKGAAYMDSSMVLVDHLTFMWKTCRVVMFDGMLMDVQALGGASTIFKSLHVNGILICLKV